MGAESASPLQHYAVPLAVAVAVGVPFLALIVYGVVQARRRDRAWRHVGRELEMGGRGGAFSRPRLSGSYRGRAVEAEHQGSYYLRVAARAANHARLLDEVRSGGPLPAAPWLTAPARAKLAALGQGRGAGRRWWKIRVEGHLVTLTCLGTETDAARLRHLLDLACDLAEGVDAVAKLPTLPPEAPPAPPLGISRF